MRYYTKEWYALAGQQSYTSGMKVIPDRDYSTDEIKAFYDQALQEEIERDRKIHDTPPDFGWMDPLLLPETFIPENFLFEDPQTGTFFHPATPAQAREMLDLDRARQADAFANRPPFDPAETIQCFRQCYRCALRTNEQDYPAWVTQTVDRRLLALQMIPESAYSRLQKEEAANRRRFSRIMKKAREELEAQEIPADIRDSFCFHDAYVLGLRKSSHDVELILRRDGLWPGGTPYVKVVFRQVSRLEREKGLVIRPRFRDDGVASNCQYLYDELYRLEDGYEVHLLLWTMRALRYVTIWCREIRIEEMEYENRNAD